MQDQDTQSWKAKYANGTTQQFTRILSKTRKLENGKNAAASEHPNNTPESLLRVGALPSLYF